jgi:peptide/nickel transport system substrate-binding protein
MARKMHDMRRFFGAALAFLLVGSALAQSSIVIGTQASTAFRPNPLWSTSIPDFVVMSLILPGLAGFDGEMQATLELASAVDISDDLTRYTFTIDENAVWSDGSPVTANDVKFTWELRAHPTMIALPQPPIDRTLALLVEGTAAFGNGEADEITGIRVLDARTVEFTLVAPNVGFVRAASLGILPSHVFEGLSVDEIVAHPYLELPTVTSGPFRVGEYVRGEFWRLERVTGHWGEEAQVDTLVVRTFAEAEALFSAIDAGEVNVALVPATQLERFASNPGLQVIRRPGLGYYVLHIHQREPRVLDSCSADTYATMTQPRAPIDDVRVRQAMAWALNYDEIIDVLAAGAGTRIDSAIFGPSWLLDEGLVRYEYDPERASELLSQAGWVRDGAGLVDAEGNAFRTLTYVSTSTPEGFELGVLIQDYLGAVGIPVEIRLTTSANFLPTVLDGVWDFARNSGGNFGRDPSEANAFYASCAGWANAMGFSDAAFDDAMRRGAATADLDVRAEAYLEASARLNDLLPSLFLFTQDQIMVADISLANVSGTSGSHMAWDAVRWTWR